MGGRGIAGVGQECAVGQGSAGQGDGPFPANSDLRLRLDAVLKSSFLSAETLAAVRPSLNMKRLLTQRALLLYAERCLDSR
ncbi:hypothetical protein JZ751_012562 [Albula glossodonta]|uniref:Uncharacterized protein n=1 Tax=Albula glossodonta TaxID=121402 RepID=A0A8T2P384_9TELE|nr:hypothetical protein JZ751_012562 [Albula glossodonta]